MKFLNAIRLTAVGYANLPRETLSIFDDWMDYVDLQTVGVESITFIGNRLILTGDDGERTVTVPKLPYVSWVTFSSKMRERATLSGRKQRRH